MKDRPGVGSFVVVKTKTANSQDGLPKSFLNRFGEQVTGILSGLDRVSPCSGQIRANFQGEVSSRLQNRPEGVRIRHTLNGKEAAEVCRPVTRNGKRYRGLNALAQKDHALLLALSRGEFALTSIRNADLRALLYPSVKTSKTSKAETRRTSAAITRQFALMRAHGLLRKLSSTHRYQLTAKGRRIITALIAACNADVEQLTKMAA